MAKLIRHSNIAHKFLSVYLKKKNRYHEEINVQIAFFFLSKHVIKVM